MHACRSAGWFFCFHVKTKLIQLMVYHLAITYHQSLSITCTILQYSEITNIYSQPHFKNIWLKIKFIGFNAHNFYHILHTYITGGGPPKPELDRKFKLERENITLNPKSCYWICFIFYQLSIPYYYHITNLTVIKFLQILRREEKKSSHTEDSTMKIKNSLIRAETHL